MKFFGIGTVLLVWRFRNGCVCRSQAEEANAVIDQWSAAYSANDREAHRRLYAPDAILLGTTSPVISEGTEGMREYFQELPGSGRKTHDRRGERTTVLSRNFRRGDRILQFYSDDRRRYSPPITLYNGCCKTRRSLDDRTPLTRHRCRPHANNYSRFENILHGSGEVSARRHFRTRSAPG